MYTELHNIFPSTLANICFSYASPHIVDIILEAPELKGQWRCTIKEPGEQIYLLGLVLGVNVGGRRRPLQWEYDPPLMWNSL